jgi:predicted ABC-type ATPase
MQRRQLSWQRGHLHHPVIAATPWLRVFAGPKGSGKSVLKGVLPLSLLEIYLNPDEIEASIRQNGFLDLGAFGISAGPASPAKPSCMSHPGKVALLEKAQQAGYRTYLYLVATDDPEINGSRVRNRVGLGGHPVPEDKIISRYHRSLALLLEAIKYTNRVYILDNSIDSSNPRLAWLAEVTDGQLLVLKIDRIPAWFQRAVIQKIA